MRLATPLRGFSFGCLALALAACEDEPTKPPLERNTPHRDWIFRELPANRSAPREAKPRGRQTGGVVNDLHNYGRLAFRVDGDSTATGHVFSSATGETYWVLA